MDLSVPNVEGMSKADAEQAFADSGLKYQFVGDGDTVLEQIPKGGTTLPEASTVMLYTKEVDGDEVMVPDVLNCAVSEANRRITNAGLNMKIAGSAEVADGEAVVASQDPPAETMVQRGSVVTVEFSYTDVH